MIRVAWPARSIQGIPEQANSIVVEVYKGDTPWASPLTIPRPSGQATSKGEIFIDATSGLTVIAKAYAAANPSIADTPLAQGIATDVNVVDGQQTPVAITLAPLAPPSLTSVSPDNAGFGAKVKLTGGNLGADTGAPFTLKLYDGTQSFDITTSSAPTRTANGATHYIDFTLPDGVPGTEIVVGVNGNTATGTLKVLSAVAVSPLTFSMASGSTRTFTATASVADMALSVLDNPTLTWELLTPAGATDSPFMFAMIDPVTGVASGYNPGTVWVKAATGKVFATASLTITP